MKRKSDKGRISSVSSGPVMHRKERLGSLSAHVPLGRCLEVNTAQSRRETPEDGAQTWPHMESAWDL